MADNSLVVPPIATLKFETKASIAWYFLSHQVRVVTALEYIFDSPGNTPGPSPVSNTKSRLASNI